MTGNLHYVAYRDGLKQFVLLTVYPTSRTKEVELYHCVIIINTSYRGCTMNNEQSTK